MWTTLARICWVATPRGERFPPETLRLATGWPQGLFSAPVGRVDRWIEEKSEDGRQVDGQMRGEAFQRRRAHRLIDQVGEVLGQPGARDRGAMARDVTRRSAVAHGERLLQDGMDPLGPLRARMIGWGVHTAMRASC